MPFILPSKRIYHKPLSRYLDTVGDGSGTKNAAVDYSSGVQEFKISPAAGETFFIDRLISTLKSSTTLGANVYGDGAALTNGLEVKLKNGSGDIVDLLDGEKVKQNVHFARFSDFGDVLESFGGGGGGTPADADIFASHFNGADEGTTFTDDSANGHNFTAVSTAATDTAQTKFGATSLRCETGGAGTSVAIDKACLSLGGYHSSFDMDASWTVSGWFRSDSHTGHRGILLVNDTFGADAGKQLWILKLGTTGLFSIWIGLGPVCTDGGPASALNTWNHVVFQCNDNGANFTYNIWINGTRKGDATTATGKAAGGNGVWIGVIRDTLWNYNFWSGWIDELEIFNSAQYTPSALSITVPSSEYTGGGGGGASGKDLNSKLDFLEYTGQPIVLRGDLGEYLTVRLNDDFSGLTDQYFMAQGYEGAWL